MAVLPWSVRRLPGSLGVAGGTGVLVVPAVGGLYQIVSGPAIECPAGAGRSGQSGLSDALATLIAAMERRTYTRWAAIVLASAMTVPYLALFIQSLRAVIDPESVPRDLLLELASLGASMQGEQAWIAFSYLAAIVGAVTLVVILIIVGLIARRQAAREAAFAVFGGITLVAGLAGIGSLIGGSPSSGTWLGAGTAVVFLAVIVLLSLQSTSIDFELAEMERQQRASG